MSNQTQPYDWQYAPRLQRGDTRGLGKRIIRDGKWVGQSRCDVQNGSQVFLIEWENGSKEIIRTNRRNAA